jgi:hypothetical protein
VEIGTIIPKSTKKSMGRKEKILIFCLSFMRELPKGKMGGEILQETEFGVSMALLFRQSFARCVEIHHFWLTKGHGRGYTYE